MMVDEIESVKRALAAWRESHGGKLRNVPLSLRKRTARLLLRHRWSEVKEGVNISNSTLSAWRAASEINSGSARSGTGGDRRNAAKPCSSKTSARTGKNIKKAKPLAAKPSGASSTSGLFEEVDPHVVKAAIAIAPPGVLVELQTPAGVSVRIRGGLNADSVCRLVQAVCDNQGGRR